MVVKYVKSSYVFAICGELTLIYSLVHFAGVAKDFVTDVSLGVIYQVNMAYVDCACSSQTNINGQTPPGIYT